MANEISAEQYKVLKNIENNIRKTIINNLHVNDNVLNGRIDNYSTIEGKEVVVLQFMLNGIKYNIEQKYDKINLATRNQQEQLLLMELAKQIVANIVANRCNQDKNAK